jgi:3-deoxy-D-arabino-heptulosonate 7-phosphate (DAHP) synthase
MEGAERDNTQDWMLPTGAVPPLLSELEERIDEALIVAKASEKAVMAVGDAALDAAEQARRAADLAERATAAVLNGALALPAAEPLPRQPPEDAALRSFSERADRVVARLQALERLSLPAQG